MKMYAMSYHGHLKRSGRGEMRGGEERRGEGRGGEGRGGEERRGKYSKLVIKRVIRK